MKLTLNKLSTAIYFTLLPSFAFAANTIAHNIINLDIIARDENKISYDINYGGNNT
ncbi:MULTISPECIES: hypothetical protein [Photorhabdus]|uniref:Uncharacterized protein n=2 Tax=Photorhabdus TaxID=29487 RepID=A0AAW6BPL7_9GAMM|nr:MULTISPECIES: hypothetical protein [Photorhabdus]EYU15109.1 hypothetical protein BA1DRAFT_02379 [Photorhabdus aegyptia]MDB6373954.1 hypothetical protein [Photorhabdus bodei]